MVYSLDGSQDIQTITIHGRDAVDEHMEFFRQLTLMDQFVHAMPVWKSSIRNTAMLKMIGNSFPVDVSSSTA